MLWKEMFSMPTTAAKQRNEINKNNLGYTVSLGLPALRTKISKLYGDWYNLDLNPNRITNKIEKLIDSKIVKNLSIIGRLSWCIIKISREI